MTDFYDLAGQPMAFEEWMWAMEDPTRRQVNRTLTGHASRRKVVSTIWLGLNHNYGEGAPLIFETMMFNRHSNRPLLCRRYATHEEAIAGHHAVALTYRYNRRQRRCYAQRARIQ